MLYPPPESPSRRRTPTGRPRALRNGAPSTILVTGSWNVFEDGDVARRAYGNAGLQASLQLTRRANATIQSVAASTGARYVDLLAPFQQAGKGIATSSLRMATTPTPPATS